MHPNTRRRKIRAVAEALDIAARGLPTAEAEWELMRPGLKARSFAPSSTGRIEVDDDGTGRPGHADPTGNLGSMPSAVRRAERELDAALERAEACAWRAAVIVARVASPR